MAPDTLAAMYEEFGHSCAGSPPGGVYLFRGERGEVLYIGKAKSLRGRSTRLLQPLR